MALTDEQRDALRAAAEQAGVDADALIGEAETLRDDEEPDAEDDDEPTKDAAAGGESGAKAHGGRGYYAYEFPFLTVNEIRASLFLDPVADGEDLSGEWLKKHGGAA